MSCTSTLCASVFDGGIDMNNELQLVWEALRKIYGSDLTAATLVVLVKDGDTAVKFGSFHFPQETEE